MKEIARKFLPLFDKSASAEENSQITLQRKQRGQGMVEYIIIVALIAIGSIAVFRIFGDTARSQVAEMAIELSGGDGDSSNAEAEVEGAQDQVSKGLNDFASGQGTSQ